MRREVPNKHHYYSFSFVFLFFFLILFPDFSISTNTLSATESLTISSNKTIVSLGDVFELGFFTILGDSWYLGIWYKKIPEKTYVWVANRDNPISTSTGILKISNANLVLLNHFDTPVWSTNLTAEVKSPVVAELLDNGNFVLRDSKTNGSDEFLWQSFDFPTDTLLPQMKLGLDHKKRLNKFLRSWKSSFDMSSGDYLFKIETLGLPEFFIWMSDFRVFRSGPWNGIRFSGMLEMQKWDDIIYNLTENKEEVAFTFRPTDHNLYSRLTINYAGLLQQFTWDPIYKEWNMLWSTSTDNACETYNPCGPYAYCDMSTSPMCNCVEGFKPRNPQEWALGDVRGRCQRTTPLNCGRDGFTQLRKIKLPDTTAAIVDKRIGFKDCKERCAKTCNCTAFANTDIRNGGSGCVIWIGRFVDIRNYAADGQDLYVRVAAANIGDRKHISGQIIGLIVGVSLLLLVSFIMYWFWKKKQKQARATAAPNVYRERTQHLTNGVVISSGRHLFGENKTEELELPLTEFEAVVMATDNFSDSNILGQGGFGVVYMGRLPDGQEIAVKRLSMVSLQGVNEFKNEVKLIARLQHINLVRLFSCCIYADEKILIYEYLENGSLDSHLFKKVQSSKLNWQKRFNIINGIARGLLYLHQDSRFKIIHRDLKASNVLLDKDMTPKISDFGMARIFEREETEASTKKVVGTYGYMSPEYAMDGIFSVKSDVFSFGVLVLEIVSGKRNRGFYNSNQDNNLLSYTWDHWKEGKWLEIADPIIVGTSSSSSTFRPHEVLRCLQIGLLCVQERAEDRPKMSSVVFMLGNEKGEIPQPKPPGYCIGRSFLETDSSSSTQRNESSTINQFTVSVINAR
ncbi:unnamed protein product [Arabidopsis lyrata]|uniref:Receptor-like serine/threonine-protein kinase n=1 Tax=Arabidopsis lyrata subsp. lyrata TaxID=81972 RepID=D7MEU5_ARALL|nr:G-type lectin S-receptor-like serine/threonine-protein kinase SRK [Arabidopsis lyrata subsp. lyrata]EFH46149.1 predicted protein [Arabidopsis lyrata subsp. lyrata]CAH8275870.1 unnamed protein product [Arabidopsis lyrata]|eukprot:XP_002869890.1 G-type lectin S-receptor-like serine/threonine-protein kinase SRK [Arabidopsis lyrata subsp. lyrata]